jgi:hypothetical protein
MPRETVWRRLWGQVKSTAGCVVVSPGREFEPKPRFFLFFFIVYIISTITIREQSNYIWYTKTVFPAEESNYYALDKLYPGLAPNPFTQASTQSNGLD